MIRIKFPSKFVAKEINLSVHVNMPLTLAKYFNSSENLKSQTVKIQKKGKACGKLLIHIPCQNDTKPDNASTVAVSGFWGLGEK